MSELPSFIADHLKRYQDSDGADGHMWDSTAVGGPGLLPCLLLTTKGRRSGKEQPLPLIYGKCDNGYVVVASKGGAPANPGWYLNLVDEPRVGVQVGADRFVADARTATGSERATLWDEMAVVYPPYLEYQQKTEREIPVVVLERAE